MASGVEEAQPTPARAEPTCGKSRVVSQLEIVGLNRPIGEWKFHPERKGGSTSRWVSFKVAVEVHGGIHQVVGIRGAQASSETARR